MGCFVYSLDWSSSVLYTPLVHRIKWTNYNLDWSYLAWQKVTGNSHRVYKWNEDQFLTFKKSKYWFSISEVQLELWYVLKVVLAPVGGLQALWSLLSVLWLLLWSPAYWTSSMWAWCSSWKAGTQLPMCPRNGSQTLSEDIPSPRSWQRICQINLWDLAMVVNLGSFPQGVLYFVLVRSENVFEFLYW